MKGILLVNLGTPDSPSTKDVRKYLREFLMDKYVIDLPYLYRWFLVNVIIATFRAPKSAKIYKQLWTKNGSPLLYFGLKIEKLLQAKLKEGYYVRIAMRYQSPSIKSVLVDFKKKNIQDLTILPLYPQYASSSTKTCIEKVKTDMKSLKYNPEVKFIENFVAHSSFTDLFAELGMNYWKTGDFDKVLFSFHGIPERHVLNDSDDEISPSTNASLSFTNASKL